MLVTVDAAQLQGQAARLLPREVYDYYAGGSGRERTLRANRRAWDQVWLAPRVLRGGPAPDTATSLLGARLATPVCVAPTGYHGLAHPHGEVASAAGAARAGALYVLSARSTRRIEDVAAAVAAERGTWWFQVYIMRDRELTAGLVRRATAAGARALVLTADTPVVGRKRRDTGKVPSHADLVANIGPLEDLDDPEATLQAGDLGFADIGWLSEVGGGLPVVVKGVLRGDDARSCLAHGAAGVIVSNHGGRQLDGAVPAALALSDVAATVGAAGPDGAQPERPAAPAVLGVDGGIRTGEQVLAGLALGAGAVFVGRPVLWALACGGADGVQEFLSGLTDDLAHAMTLAGVGSVATAPGIVRRC